MEMYQPQLDIHASCTGGKNASQFLAECFARGGQKLQARLNSVPMLCIAR
jgi:hypothetical protein